MRRPSTEALGHADRAASPRADASATPAGARAATLGNRHTNRTSATEIALWERSAHSSPDGCKEMLLLFHLRAGPRSTALSLLRPAVPVSASAGTARDTADSGSDGIPCPAHWPGNTGWRANAANAVPPAGTPLRSTAPAASAAETTAHNPSTDTAADADDDQSTLDRLYLRRHTGPGPREVRSRSVKSRSGAVNSSPRRFYCGAGRSHTGEPTPAYRFSPRY
jgi:hypothetical protein